MLKNVRTAVIAGATALAVSASAFAVPAQADTITNEDTGKTVAVDVNNEPNQVVRISQTTDIVFLPLDNSGKPRFKYDDEPGKLGNKPGNEVTVVINGTGYTGVLNKDLTITVPVPNSILEKKDFTKTISVNHGNVPHTKDQQKYCVNFGELKGATQPVKLDPKKCSPAKDVTADNCKQEKTAAAVIGVLGLLTTIASFLPIPGVKDAITNVQKALGIHNPQMAAAAEKAMPALGGLVGLTSLITAIALPAKCATDNAGAVNPGGTTPDNGNNGGSSGSSMPIK